IKVLQPQPTHRLSVTAFSAEPRIIYRFLQHSQLEEDFFLSAPSATRSTQRANPPPNLPTTSSNRSRYQKDCFISRARKYTQKMTAERQTAKFCDGPLHRQRTTSAAHAVQRRERLATTPWLGIDRQPKQASIA
ncbi:hypothetical protein PSQ40_19925, partial [Curvibacter sp. HBC61]